MEAKNEPEKSPKVKLNGCMCPFHPFQIMAYAVFLFYAYVFYFINVVAWSDTLGLLIPFVIVYSILLALLLAVGFMATLSDPTDPTVYDERRKRSQKYR